MNWIPAFEENYMPKWLKIDVFHQFGNDTLFIFIFLKISHDVPVLEGG